MAIAFETEERVAVRPEVAWRRLTDWEGAPAWMGGIDSMAASGPTEVGTQLEFHARGKSRTSEISHVVEGREVTLTSRQGPVSADYSYRCEPEGEGTRLALVADCEIRGPLRLLGPLLRRAMARTDGGQLRALKSILEGAAP